MMDTIETMPFGKLAEFHAGLLDILRSGQRVPRAIYITYRRVDAELSRRN